MLLLMELILSHVRPDRPSCFDFFIGLGSSAIVLCLVSCSLTLFTHPLSSTPHPIQFEPVPILFHRRIPCSQLVSAPRKSALFDYTSLPSKRTSLMSWEGVVLPSETQPLIWVLVFILSMLATSIMALNYVLRGKARCA